MKTRKKAKIIGREQYINQRTGELEEFTVMSVEDKDFNFHKIWLGQILYSLDIIGNQKTKLAFWLLEHMTNDNLIPMTLRQMSKESGVSLETVSQTVKALLDSNFLLRMNIGVYRINPDMVFKGGTKERCKLLIEYNKTKEKPENSVEMEAQGEPKQHEEYEEHEEKDAA